MWQVLQGNALDVLKTLESESVHCCVTSPPYWGLRSYLKDDDPLKLYELGAEATLEEYVQHMVEVFREVRRVLRRDGTLWIVLGDCHAHPGKGGPWDEGRVQKGTGSALYSRQANRGMLPGLKPKDLVGIPWRVAFALRDDGWWLRADIIWAKCNPMPESVTDRPTKSHEYVFLLTKNARYFYDAEAVKENGSLNSHGGGRYHEQRYSVASGRMDGGGARFANAQPAGIGGRNRRSVWTIATQPFAGAHFATYPPRLVEICIKAGTSAAGCCPRCGAPWVRITEEGEPDREWQKRCGADASGGYQGKARKNYTGAGVQDASAVKARILAGMRQIWTVGWRPTCSCDSGDPVPCTVLDPFAGAGTTLYVAEKLGRNSIGIELNPSYIEDIIKPRMASIRYVEHPMFA